MTTDEPQLIKLSLHGVGKITAQNIEMQSQVEVLNPEQYICEVTDKNTNINVEMKIEMGLGYLPKEAIQKEKVDVGMIALDAAFTPIRRVNYEVETMRIGDRTDYNRLKITIETDGTLTPRSAIESAIEIMIHQLKAIIEYKEEELIHEQIPSAESMKEDEVTEDDSVDTEFLRHALIHLIFHHALKMHLPRKIFAPSVDWYEKTSKIFLSSMV